MLGKNITEKFERNTNGLLQKNKEHAFNTLKLMTMIT